MVETDLPVAGGDFDDVAHPDTGSDLRHLIISSPVTVHADDAPDLLGVHHDDLFGFGVVVYDIRSLGHVDVRTAGFCVKLFAERSHHTAAVFSPIVVLTDLELAADRRFGADPGALIQDHVDIFLPVAVDADQAPDGTVGDHQHRFGAAQVEGQEPVAGREFDVVAAGKGREGFTDVDHVATVVLVPAAVFAPLELGIFRSVDTDRPDTVVFRGEDIVVPVAVETDDVPAADRLVDGDRLRFRVVGHDVVAFSREHDVRAILTDSFERLAEFLEVAADAQGPVVVVAELEAVGVEMRDGAHPLAVGQDHIHIAGPAVEVADQAPDIAVADGDRIVGRIEHDFPETCGNLDVRAAGHRLERLIQGHERSAEVGIPGTVETPLEFRSFRHGDVGRPEAAVVGGEDVVLPVTVQADDVPARDRLRLRTGFIAADDAGYLGTRGFGHLGKAGARIHEEVEDTVGTDHDVRAVLRDFEFSVKAAEGTAHVHGPGFVLTELELVACGKGDAERHVPVAVGNHGQVAVTADAVLRQGADDRPVARFLEIGERIVSFADPSGSGLRIDEQVIVAVGTDHDVRTILRRRSTFQDPCPSLSRKPTGSR